MEDKNNGSFVQQSTKSKLEIESGNATESTTNLENRKADCSIQYIFVTVIDVINHTLIILVTSYLLYHAAKQYYVINVHVMLCTIGYVLLMSEAIVTLAGENIWTNALSRNVNKHIHWITQALGLISVFTGIGFMFSSKKVHFRSTHGIMGITSLAMFCTLAICGYPVLMVMKIRKFIRPVIVKVIHNILGTACYSIGMATQCYGYKKRWIYKTTRVENVDSVLLVLTVMITVLSLRGALVSLVRQAIALVRLILPSTS